VLALRRVGRLALHPATTAKMHNLSLRGPLIPTIEALAFDPGAFSSGQRNAPPRFNLLSHLSSLLNVIEALSCNMARIKCCV
jgi:hypothetical protein